MNSTISIKAEPSRDAPWTGVREVLAMSGPIILSSLSYTLMEFADKWMVAQLGTAPLAAAGSASIWSYTMSTLILGIVGCVSTFVAQCVGRNEKALCGRYAWQGFYVSCAAGLVALTLWPVSGPLFRAMGHTEAVTDLELVYFRIRLLGYVPMAWAMCLSSFFQAISRSTLPMYTALIGNLLNIVLNYLLIFGKLGFPMLGIAGAAWATCIAQVVQAALLHWLFLRPIFDAAYKTRGTWQLDLRRFRELVRIGIPAGFSMFIDIANWGIFVSFVVGRFGEAQLAANNAALSFMHLSFMPAVALNQGIAAIAGQWIGRGDIPRAKARTYTAVRMAMGYMFCMGILFAVFGGGLIGMLFTDDPHVIRLGHSLLILAAVFQGFDAITIVTAGALRGAGDTQWMLRIMFVAAYLVFLPVAWALAFPLGGQAYGAWVGATVYIIGLSALFLMRFHGERWREICIFKD